LQVDPSSLVLYGYEKVHDINPSPHNPVYHFPDSYFIHYIVKNVDNEKVYKPRHSLDEKMTEAKWFNKDELKEYKWFVERPGVLDAVFNILNNK